MSAKRAKDTYFSIASHEEGWGADVYRDVKLPSGETARVMNKRVFDGATASAGRSLRRVHRTRKGAEIFK
ncbi:MAG: hypothetical protein JNM75_13470 [Rhodospirillales bacterium]|nr:hypothetical protein [Rhodospirillales bacterium]